MMTGKREQLEELVQLYDLVERARQGRARLFTYGLYYMLAMVVIFAISRLARVSLAAAAFGLVMMVLVGVVVGLLLLSRFIKNEVERREAEREIERIKQTHGIGGKRKRRERDEAHESDDAIRYTIGDDGELIELSAADVEPESAAQNGHRRKQ